MATKTALLAEVGTNFPDNTVGAITPAILRTTINDEIVSWQQAPQVNAQIGLAYTVSVNDYGQLVQLANASPVAVTLPAATASGFFPFNVLLKNSGAGDVIVTPASGSIDGGSSLTLHNGESAWVVSNGTNWITGIRATLAGGSIFSSSTPGLAPATGGVGAAFFLNAAGAWVTPSGAGNVTGTAPSVIGRLALWNNTSATALIDGADWGISTHSLVPVNDNAVDIGILGSNRVRAFYGVTYNGVTFNGQAFNMQGTSSGQITHNAPAAISSYALTWPAASPSVFSGVLVTTAGAISFAPVLQPTATAALTAGFTANSSNIGSTFNAGTLTPTIDSTHANLQFVTLNGGSGALVFNPPASDTSLVLDIINSATPGYASITTTSWNKVTGDSLTAAANTHFRCYCTVLNSFKHLHVTQMA